MPNPPRDGSTSQYHNELATNQLLQGINTMQMQAGLMPGGFRPPLAQMPMASVHPSDFSSALRVNLTQSPNPALFNTTPMPMGGGVTPGYTGFELPRSSFGYGGMQHRAAAGYAVNNALAIGQAGLGLGSRAGAGMLAGGIGMMLGGTSGAVAGLTGFEHFGLGQVAQTFGSNLLNPILNRRAETAQLQNMSLGFVRGGQDLSGLGMGLSATAAGQLRSGLTQMAGSSQFQRDTGFSFNKQDVMKITSLSAQLGMLDQSQTADQIKNEVGKISRALSNFVKIAEEPDIQKAMQMMAGMRNAGMATSEIGAAARNARQFARMAGTDMAGIFEAGSAGAGAYQARGLSAAAGLNAGMASVGIARQASALMSPAGLAMAGGEQGIANTLMEGGASAASLSALLPGMVRRGAGGRLIIDREALSDLTSGRVNIQEFMRRGASRGRDLGAQGMEELITRRSELQDEMSRGMGGMNATLLPMVLARRVMQSVPGMTMRGALMTMGMGEQQAGTYAQMARDPRFIASMQQQAATSAREQITEARERGESRQLAGRVPEWAVRVEHALDRVATTFTRSADRVAGIINTAQDEAEQISAQGGAGNLIRIVGRPGDYQGSAVARAAVGEGLRTQSGRDAFAASFAASGRAAQGRIAREEQAGYNQALYRGVRMLGVGAALGSMAHDRLMGSEGGAMPFLGPARSEFFRETVMRQEDIGTRLGDFTGITALTGNTLTPAEVAARAAELTRTGRELQQGTMETPRQSRRQSAAIAALFNRPGVSAQAQNSQRERAVAAAAEGQRQYLDSIHGPFNIQTGRFNPVAMQQAMAERMIASGVDPGTARQLAASSEFRVEAAAATRGTLTEQQQAQVDSLIGGGGDINAADTAREISARRAEAGRVADFGLEALGMGRGALGGLVGGAADADRNALGSALAGRGRAAEMARLITTQRALAARGASSNDPVAQRMAAQLNERIRRERAANPDLITAAERQVENSGLSEDALQRMGRQLATAGDADKALNLMQSGQNNLARADRERAGAAITEAFGATAARAMQAAGGTEAAQYAAVQRMVARGESVGLSEEDIESIRQDSGGSGAGMAAFRRAIQTASQRAQAPRQVFSREGIGEIATRVIRGQTEGLLGEIVGGEVMGATEVSEAEAGEAGAAASNTFEEAVGVFGEASSKLLEAANAFGTASTVGGLGRTMARAVTGDIIGAVESGVGMLMGR